MSERERERARYVYIYEDDSLCVHHITTLQPPCVACPSSRLLESSRRHDDAGARHAHWRCRRLRRQPRYAVHHPPPHESQAGAARNHHHCRPMPPQGSPPDPLSHSSQKTVQAGPSGHSCRQYHSLWRRRCPRTVPQPLADGNQRHNPDVPAAADAAQSPEAARHRRRTGTRVQRNSR